MKASGFEFRFRFVIHFVTYALGFWAPWDLWLHLDGTGPNAHVWGMLSALLAKSGAMGIATAFNVLLVAGILCAVAGAWLRTWGSAYLGVGVMRDGAMRGDGVTVDGPYRYMRNPLYAGTFLHTLALALLMPVSGAVFAVVVIGVFQIRLGLGEEAFLTAKLGAAYTEYCAVTPRWLPALRPRVAGSGMRPLWGPAVAAEIYMWGVAGSFAVAGWWYNAHLLMQCVLVSVGVSLVLQGMGRSERLDSESGG